MDAELQLFLWSILYGVGIMFFYDLIRSVRNVFKHGKILITVGDFLFWIGIGIFLFTRLYIANGGILRGYFFLGVLSGMLAYYGTISPWVVKFVSFLIKRVKMLFSWVKIMICRVLHVKLFTGIFKNGEIFKKKKKKKGKSRRTHKAE